MVGLGKFAGAGLVAFALTACGSSGVSPKAYETAVPAAPSVDLSSVTADEPIQIAPEVASGFEFLYRFITETEFVLCLEGTRDGDRIIVDGFRLARMEATSVNSVRYQPCDSPRYVGTAHNHPPVDDPNKSLCYQSEPDRRSFGMDARAAIDIVLCGDKKFLWVTKDGRSAAKSAN